MDLGVSGEYFLPVHPIDPVRIGVEEIVGPLMADKEKGQDAEGHPDGQSQHVDRRVEFVSD